MICEPITQELLPVLVHIQRNGGSLRLFLSVENVSC